MYGDKSIIPDDVEVGTIAPELALKHSGLELLQMMIAGELPPPPIAKLANILLSEAELGKAVFRGIPSRHHYNPMGTAHGGWAATILDSALGCAVMSMVPVGMIYTTVELKVNLLRPVFESTGEVVCEGNILHFGRTIATAEAKLLSREGKLIAHGTTTCAVMKVPGEGY